jgi:hypothetical protein
MNKYNGLLSSVAHKYHICKGARETENEWKTRLVYSICGMMAYASLWTTRKKAPVSIVHLKRRSPQPCLQITNRCTRSCLAAYHTFPKSSKMRVADQFLRTGVVYHRPNRIAPSMKHEEAFGDILFQRGIALDSISCVSGIGFYSKQYGAKNTDKIKAMFGLDQENLQTLWRITLSAASWKSDLSFEQNTEYLRLKPPFSQGYWVNKPDTTGTVSILRTGMKGSQLYYLYRYYGTTMEVSPLPQWQVESYNYRSLACACLSTYGTLPPIEYFEDGALVPCTYELFAPTT